MENLMATIQNLSSLVTFETFLKMLALYFFIFWIAIIIWVTKDIINRTNNILLQILSISTVLFLTPLWVVIYLLIRPSRTLLEKYYEQGNFDDSEDEFAIENESEEEVCCSPKEELKCFSCSAAISPDFHFCPNCKIALKKECAACHKELNADWKICPYCGKEEEKIEDKIVKEEEIISTDDNIS